MKSFNEMTLQELIESNHAARDAIIAIDCEKRPEECARCLDKDTCDELHDTYRRTYLRIQIKRLHGEIV